MHLHQSEEHWRQHQHKELVSQHPAKKINKIYLTNKDHNESTCQQATLQCIEMAY